MTDTIYKIEKGAEYVKPIIQQAVLTDFRPVFILMLVILLVFFVFSIIGGGSNKRVTFGMTLSISITHLLIAGILFYIESNLVEQLDYAADNITMYLFVSLLVLAIVNPLVYKLRNKNSSSRYRYRRY